MKSIDCSSFKTPLLRDIGNMFEGCSSLTSIDLSTFNTTKLNSISALFQGCNELSYIDISTFHELLNYDKYDFLNVNNSGEIKVNKNISLIIQSIFEGMNWTITEI